MEVEEYSIVVDKNDNVIEYKKRSDLTPKDRIRIVITWIEDGKGNALIHKRSYKKKHGANMWENAAAGGVVRGESYEEAAYKELEEEIGLKGIKLTPVTTRITETIWGDRMVGWFIGYTDIAAEDLTPETDCVDEIKWVNKIELFDDRDRHPEKYMPSSIYWRELFSDK